MLALIFDNSPGILHRIGHYHASVGGKRGGDPHQAVQGHPFHPAILSVWCELLLFRGVEPVCRAAPVIGDF